MNEAAEVSVFVVFVVALAASFDGVTTFEEAEPNTRPWGSRRGHDDEDYWTSSECKKKKEK